MTATIARQSLRFGLRIGLCLALATVASGCSTFDALGVSHWFSGPSGKSKLKAQRIPVLTANDALRPDPKLDKVPVTLPRPYAIHNWPEPGGYSTNAMYHLEASGPLQQIWTQDAGKGSDSSSRLTAPPVVADGRLYVLDSEAHVFAFNAASGAPLWNRELAPRGSSNLLNEFSLGLIGQNTAIDPSKGMGGGAAFDGGKLFVTTGFGSVYAFDPASGKQLWSRDIGVPIVNAPVANGGRVFVSTEDNHFYALAEADEAADGAGGGGGGSRD